MSTTLQADSFSRNNIRERTSLVEGVPEGASAIKVASTQGYEAGSIIYVGELAREQCEKAVVESLADGMTVSLVSPLKYPHAAFADVTGVLGDLVHFYRAANVDGKVPADDQFTVLATRDIDPDQPSTYMTDTSGGSEFWYRSTYFNATTNEETALDAVEARRGQDWGNYCSLDEIRDEAGFTSAFNLNDSLIFQHRRSAQSEINTALGSVYTVPFKPVPEIIRTLTIKLAAGMLLQSAYGERSSQASLKLKEARDQIKAMQDRDQTISDEEGHSIAGGGITSWPGEDQPRAFHMGDRF